MKIRTYLKSIDLFLLLFLSLFTMDKVAVKPIILIICVALIFRQISFRDFRTAPLFYIFMPIWALINFLFINSDFSSPHLVSFCIGIGYWLMALFAFIFTRKRVESRDVNTIHHTLTAFFYINLLWSAGNIFLVMLRAHSLNPFMLTAEAYGSSTGDFIKGIFMGPSYINMFINAFFSIYFLFKGKNRLALLAAIIACLTTSNFANFIFIFVLIICFFIIRQKNARITIFIQLSFYVLFYIFVSHSNLTYIEGTVKTITTHQEASERKLEEHNDTVESHAMESITTSNPKMTSTDIFNKYKFGKIISFLQTYYYLTSSAKKFIFGAGIGEFSSQLAVRTSNLPVPQKSRLFEKLPVYIAPSFYENNYKIFYAIYSLPYGYHSIRHLPNSTANQIFGEYGFVGFLLFIVFYVFYFLKKFKQLSYGLLIAFVLGYFLLFDYVFEYLSVTVFFELFFLLNIKESITNKVANDK